MRERLPEGLKRLLRPVWQMGRAAVQRVRLALLKRRLERVPAGSVPDRELLQELINVWANAGWSADADYLAEIFRETSRARGPILECGSGLSTLVLAIASRKNGVRVDTLEHSPEWHRHVRKHVPLRDRGRVEVHRVPLRGFGDFDWYRFDAPTDVQYSLVICDGPPGATKGGRYGLFPVMGSALRSDALILLDDAHREDERAILERWEREYGTNWVLVERPQGSFARVGLGPSVGRDQGQD